MGKLNLPGLLALVMLAVASAAPAVLVAEAEAAPRQPNIVILFADDLGYGDLGSYGHPYNRTPNLDRLATEGQRWTDFYVASPVCSPSRGALLTGRLPNRTGLYGKHLRVMFPDDRVGIPAEEVTLAEALRDQGYATGIIGKWHLGDDPAQYPTRHGFDYWYGIPYSNDMEWVGEPGFEDMMAMVAAGRQVDLETTLGRRMVKYLDPKVEYWNVPLVRSVRAGDGFDDQVLERPAQQPTITRRYTEEAVGFIQRHREQPFLLFLPYSMPHTPLFRSEAFAGRSLGGRYGDVVEELDWSAGAIVAALAEAGLFEDTLVVFTSDNGPWRTMQQHSGSAGMLKDGKGTTFEGGMRVPAIFSWPGHIAPGVVSDIGSAMDIFATALALAGVVPTTPVDAVDLSDTLVGAGSGARNSLAYYRQGELYAYRKGQYKLHLITSGSYGLPPERQDHSTPLLYDLHSDPQEQFDIAGKHPEVVADLMAAVVAHRAGMVAKAPIFDSRLQRVGG